MKEIGGYFELEINQKNKIYHSEALALNTARNCLEYILRSRKYTKIYVPYYTCDVILEPIIKLDIEYEFYNIDNELNPLFDKEIKNEEVFLYTNYFGIKNQTVLDYAINYKHQLIVDNSQSFFAKPLENIDTFYSARKFFGLPDGAFLYTKKILNEILKTDISYKRIDHLLQRIELNATMGYPKFKENDESLNNQPIKLMSKLTSYLMEGIDYEKIRKSRFENFMYLHENLASQNAFVLDDLNNIEPMVYPFLSKNERLKKLLIDNKIYIPTYWPNVLGWAGEESIESNLMNNLLPLPIDQRYGIEEMDRIIHLIK